MATNETSSNSPALRRLPKSRRDYTIVTPMMRDLKDIVQSSVENMESGLTVFSNSRAGKTRALDFVEQQMLLDAPTVHIERFVMIDLPRIIEGKFFYHLLSSAKGLDTYESQNGDYRLKLERRLLTKSAELGDSRLLLVIDEAQRLKPQQYSYLIDLTNQLERAGLDPTLLLMGQSEILGVRDDLTTSNRQDVLGRFFENLVEYERIANAPTLKKILSQYDDPTCSAFPGQSTRCITATYIPRLYQQKNFRIELCATPLWDGIVTCAAKLGVRPIIGMKSLTRTVERALTLLLVEGDAENASLSSWWEQVLGQAGYLHSLKNGSGKDER